MVGDIRGLGLFAGIEIVDDKATKAPSPESTLATIVADVKKQGHPDVPGLNNVLTLGAGPGVVTKAEIDATISPRRCLGQLETGEINPAQEQGRRSSFVLSVVLEGILI